MNPEIADIIKKLLKVYKKYKVPFNGVGIVMLFIMALQGLIHALMIDIVVFLYLTYQTLSALEDHKDDNDKLSYTLKLWGCYSTYLIAEKVIDVVMYFSPLSMAYYASKLGFYMWILKSDDNVSTYYDSVILPLFRRYKEHIDAIVHGLERYIRLLMLACLEYVNNLKDLLIGYIANQITDDAINKIEEKLKNLEDSLEKDIQPKINIEPTEDDDSSESPKDLKLQ